MRKRQYDSTIRKARAAYQALEDAFADAQYFEKERIIDALDHLQRAVNALAPQVCRDCNNTGYLQGKARPSDAEPHVAYGCGHDSIPTPYLSERNPT